MGQSNRKVFQSKVSSGAEGFVLPVATFVLDESAARSIADLALQVRQQELAHVETMSQLVTYYSENGEVLDAANELPTQSARLCVSGSEFWFTAELVGQGATVRTESLKIDDLAKQFGLDAISDEFAADLSAASPGM